MTDYGSSLPRSCRAGADPIAVLHGYTYDSTMTQNLSDEDSSKSRSREGFWIAPFALDGELLGVGEWRFDALSKHWIGVCTSLIDHYGLIFDEHLQGPLSHLRIKCTGIESAAMVVLYAHGAPAASFAVVTGAAPAVDAHVLAMFTESIRSSTQQFQVSNIEEPFGAMMSMAQRPLMVVVPWPQSHIAEQDHELVKEIGWHLATALILKGSE